MRSLRTVRAIVILAASLIVATGLAPIQARATSTVDVTYDLSDTTLEGLFGFAFDKVVNVSNSNPVNGTVAGSMKIRYASNSQSSIPIQSGTASLVSFNLTVQSLSVKQARQSGTASPYNFPYTWLQGNVHWQLTGGPGVGALTSGGALTGLSAALRLTGTAKCALPSFGSSYCGLLVGIPYGVTANISRSYTGPFNLGGSIGAYGGAQSTPHTVTGGGPASVRFKNAFALSNSLTHNGYGGAQIVGREILREGGGISKPIPEPGTLLLLGAGTAGLALVGRATRRASRRG